LVVLSQKRQIHSWTERLKVDYFRYSWIQGLFLLEFKAREGLSREQDLG
jgi:hypothetical protein